MIQNINLYNLDVSGERFTFSIAHMVKLGGILIVIFSLFTLYLSGAYFWEKFQLTQLKKQQTAILKNIEASISSMPSKEAQDELIKKIASLEEIKKDRQKIFVTLSGLQYGEKKEFSNYFSALATHGVPNVWLTELKITTNGKFITLIGKTTDSSSIPQLIKQIAASGVFSGKTFEAFSMTVDEAEPRVMNFIIKSN